MASGASTLRDALLPAIDTIRAIPSVLGMRLYTVQIRVDTWSGARVGVGSLTRGALQPIKVAAGTATITVRQRSQKDVIASGGGLQDIDFILGPITPPYPGSVKDDDQISLLDPPVGASPTEIHYFVTGPNMTAGAWFRKVEQDFSKPYHYTIVIRKTGQTAP